MITPSYDSARDALSAGPRVALAVRELKVAPDCEPSSARGRRSKMRVSAPGAAATPTSKITPVLSFLTTPRAAARGAGRPYLVNVYGSPPSRFSRASQLRGATAHKSQVLTKEGNA